MRKRYAVVAGIAMAIPCGTALAQTQGDSTAVPEASWAAMDSDGDGALSMEEVSGTPWATKFSAMDANDDRKVTKQEYSQYRQNMMSDSSDNGNDM